MAAECFSGLALEWKSWNYPIWERSLYCSVVGGHGIADVVITCEGGDLLPPEPAAHTNPLAALQHEMKGLSPKEMLQKSLGMAARAAKGGLR